MSMVALLVLLVIVMLPGILSVNVLTHELYHTFSNGEFARSICVDINKRPYVAHTVLFFPNVTSMYDYVRYEDEQELGAKRAGQIASAIYVLFSIAAMFLIVFVVADSVKPIKVRVFRHVKKHMRKVRRRIRGK